MKPLYRSQDSLFAGYLKQVLETHRIRCLLKNEHLSGAIGQLPPNECWPELWVVDDADLEPAREIVAGVLQAGHGAGEPWRCPDCGEEMEAQFTDCWKCGDGDPGTLLA